MSGDIAVTGCAKRCESELVEMPSEHGKMYWCPTCGSIARVSLDDDGLPKQIVWEYPSPKKQPIHPMSFVERLQHQNTLITRSLQGTPEDHAAAVEAISIFLAEKIRERQPRGNFVGQLAIKVDLLDYMLPKPDVLVDIRQCLWYALKEIVNKPEPPMFVSRD